MIIFHGKLLTCRVFSIAAMGKLCEVKRIRDQAYTYLKEAVDEIRRTGQYVFRRNKERYIGYISMHLRHAKSRKPGTLRRINRRTVFSSRKLQKNCRRIIINS
ncbi:MAG: hypothetical protein NT166_07690 [Candidatus Aminicenantes bacterium]|nr:hypothetical protein [Candidatus Aminicenantes bacterium]